MSLIARTSRGSVDGATCAGRTTDRQAHTRAAAVARRGIDSATIAETAGAPATEQTREHDPRRADLGLGASVGQPFVRQPESRALKHGEGKPKEGRELLHASPQLQDFLLEFRRPQVRHVQADHCRQQVENKDGQVTHATILPRQHSAKMLMI